MPPPHTHIREVRASTAMIPFLSIIVAAAVFSMGIQKTFVTEGRNAMNVKANKQILKLELFELQVFFNVKCYSADCHK